MVNKIKIQMLEDTYGAEDGIQLKMYKAGKIYTVDEQFANDLFKGQKAKKAGLLSREVEKQALTPKQENKDQDPKQDDSKQVEKEKADDQSSKEQDKPKKAGRPKKPSKKA